jgi:hypothetical protein
MTYQNNLVVAAYNGQRDSSNPDGEAPQEPVVDTYVSAYWASHSLMVWDAEIEPGSTNESSAAWWMNDMATNAGYQSGYTGAFGFIVDQATPPFPAFGFDNASFDPWPSGTYQEQNFDYHLTMPSNFAHVTFTPEQWVERGASVYDWQRDNAPEVPMIFLLHHPEPAATPTTGPDENMDATQWQIYRDYTRGFASGEYSRWFVDVQNELISTYPTLSFRTCPVGPVIADIQELPELSSLGYTDYYVDGAPHGTRLYYWLAGAVLWRMTHNELPNANGPYTPPPGFLPTVVENNIDLIFSTIDSRLSFYDSLAPANRIIVYP